jgi:hypothetical protein
MPRTSAVTAAGLLRHRLCDQFDQLHGLLRHARLTRRDLSNGFYDIFVERLNVLVVRRSKGRASRKLSKRWRSSLTKELNDWS